MTTTTCARCPRQLVPQRTWIAATTNQRATWIAKGAALHKARGLCNGCYLKAYRAGEIESVRPGVGGRGRIGSGHTRPPHPCDRCGIETRTHLCRDCQVAA